MTRERKPDLKQAERHARWRKMPASKKKLAETQKKFHAKNPSYKAHDHVLRRYGLTREQYDAILHLQGGCCAICRCGPEDSGYKRLTVDHDHGTGEVRGLLCNRCNAALGGLRDSPFLARAAAAYLESKHDHVGLVKQLV